jgi:hypothetical protein
MRDFVTRTKEMLEARIDQISHFDEKIKNIKDDISHTNKINETFQNKVQADIMNQEKNIHSLAEMLKKHS